MIGSELFEYLKNGLAVYGVWKAIYSGYGYLHQRLTSKKPKIYDRYEWIRGVEDISDDFFEGKLSVGDLVRCEGVLAREGYFYTPSMISLRSKGKWRFGSCAAEDLLVSRDFTSNSDIFHQSDLPVIQRDPAEFFPYWPGSSVPPIQRGKRLLRVLVLFPKYTEGSMFSPHCFQSIGDQRVVILPGNSEEILCPAIAGCKGIPLLVPYELDDTLLLKPVRLTARVAAIPEEIFLRLDSELLNTQVVQSYYRATRYKRQGFCLSLLTESGDTEQRCAIAPTDNLTGVHQWFAGRFFVEGHLLDIGPDQFAEVIRHGASVSCAVFGRSGWFAEAMNETGFEYFPRVARGDGSWVFYLRQPNIVAFEVSGDWRHQYERRFSNFVRLYRRTMSNLSTVLGTRMGLKTGFSLDFLWDYSKQRAVEPAGVLSSPSAQVIGQSDKKLEEVIQWLRVTHAQALANKRLEHYGA